MAYLLPSRILDMKSAVGLFAGASTNAPARWGRRRSAASRASTGRWPARQISNARTLPAFAISYPFGLVGVILAMVILRAIFRIVPRKEADLITRSEVDPKHEVAAVSIELKNQNLHGLKIFDIPGIQKYDVVVSACCTRAAEHCATGNDRRHGGCVAGGCNQRDEVSGDARALVGEFSKVDLRTVPSKIVTRHVVVTKSEMPGKTAG